MADLTNTVRWVRYEPDLLGNRALERPFYFELNGSMSKEQLSALQAELTKPLTAQTLPENATDEQRLAADEETTKTAVARTAIALRPFVKLGSEPLTIGGEAIDSLEKYLDFALRKLPGMATFLEPSRALYEINTLDARASFFSGRLSGGFTSTTRPNGASGRSQTAAR